MTRAMNDIRKGIPYIPSDPGFYREDGPVDWLRTQEGVWLHSTFPFNTRWTLDASRMGPRPFMRRLTPIGFGDLDQYGGVSGDVGFWFDDRGPLLWLRTIEGIWLVADMEAPYWWTLDVNNMPAVNLAHLHAVTLAEAQALTKTAARQKLEAKIDQRRRQGTLPLTDVPTVGLYLDRWLHQTANRVKPRVLDTYRSECNAIRGVIGGIRVDRITPETIEAMCDELAATRSGKTVHNIYIRTKQILNHAVRDKLIPVNPGFAAIPPRYEPADTIILQPGQPAAAIHAAHDPKPRKRDTLHDDQSDHDMWVLMFDLAFATGIRQAERFAITPSELVARDGIHGIEVRWQLQQLKPDATIPGWLQARHITGNFWLIPPKTRQGIRFIPLDTRTWLRLLELANKHQCAPDDLIFTRHGQPLTGNVERRRWQRALQDAGLPPVTMRAARHFFSTHLAQTGAPEDARKAIMGHAKITTTARYTHWTPETLAALADEAREAIGVGNE